MDRIRIRGGRPLTGEIAISGAKNAALPLMAACLLTDGTLRLSNRPHLVDIATLANMLVQLGVEIHMNGAAEDGHAGGVLEMTARRLIHTRAPYELVRYVHEHGALPVPLFSAGGIATPADASLMMQLGAQTVFVGSGIFKSDEPAKRAHAIVKAVAFYDKPAELLNVSKGLGSAMSGIARNEVPEEQRLAGRGW